MARKGKSVHQSISSGSLAPQSFRVSVPGFGTLFCKQSEPERIGQHKGPAVPTALTAHSYQRAKFGF